MADYIEFGFAEGTLPYVDTLLASVRAAEFANRDTIGIFPSTATGSYYIASFEPDYFEYYRGTDELISIFVERISDKETDPSVTKICFLQQDEIKTYFTVEDDRFRLNPFGGYTPNANDGRIHMDYTSQQLEFIERNYGDVEPSLQLNLQAEQTPSNIGFQNTVENSEILYSSISSLGSISREGFTISATTGSVTGLITEEAETITDVGGVVARGRRDAVGDVTTTIGVGSTATTTTVTTSGY